MNKISAYIVGFTAVFAFARWGLTLMLVILTIALVSYIAGLRGREKVEVLH